MPIMEQIVLAVNNRMQKERMTADKAIDLERREYLSKLSEELKSPIIVYANNFKNPSSIIDLDDVHSFMSMCCGIDRNKVTLFIHTPGGQINAIEALVKYIRSIFKEVDAIVPMFAFSAGTMWCCSCKKIYMGKNSFLGPIDPQIPFSSGFFPAQSILDQFEQLKQECIEKPKNLIGIKPVLEQYFPSQLTRCSNALKRAKFLVQEWLVKYRGYKVKDATKIATWLSSHNTHKDHGKPLSIDELNEHSLNITPLEENQKIQDLALSLYHLIDLSFQFSHLNKIITNSAGRIVIK